MPKAILAIGALLVVLLIGSFLYWQADGSVGTPEDFRRRVAASGLEVDWSNSGPRGGDGLATTQCGQVGVTVAEIDGVLWLTVSGLRRPLTGSVVESAEACALG